MAPRRGLRPLLRRGLPALLGLSIVTAGAPARAAHERSEPGAEVIVERDVMVPMSDGTRLAADVHRPAAPGRYPALLERTPYDKTSSSEIQVGAHTFFAERGYVVVIQDVRGRYASEGAFYPNLDDGWLARRDGHDTVHWIARQPWSNGKVGVIGGSQSGQTAYRLAPTQPPGLVAMFVRESAADLRDGWFYRGGAFEHGFVTSWVGQTFAADLLRRNLAGPAQASALGLLKAFLDDRDRFLWHLPVAGFPVFAGWPGFQFYYDWVKNATDGAYWWQQDLRLRHHQVQVPIYHLGGWYDIFLGGTISSYVGIRDRGGPEARATQKLVIGPWIHGPKNVGVTQVGALTFPSADAVQYNAIRLGWFDHWLKGLHTGVMDEPPVLLYVMGDNVWRGEREWPLARTRYTTFYFRGGPSGSLASVNDGTLSTAAPTGAEHPDSFSYDPEHPIPTLGGATLFIPSGPQDHRAADLRSLTYTSDVLREDLEVTGPVTAVLHAMSSAVDTDWTVRLGDVHPDGRSINVADGIVRARFRESATSPSLIEPGRIYRYTVDLWATSIVFKAGHRIRVSVHSSNFPRWSRNLNTAESPELGARSEVALNTVFHDALRPSHVVLPVIPR
jgi:putative CocE/NonD family hydrolase